MRWRWRTWVTWFVHCVLFKISGQQIVELAGDFVSGVTSLMATFFKIIWPKHNQKSILNIFWFAFWRLEKDINRPAIIFFPLEVISPQFLKTTNNKYFSWIRKIYIIIFKSAWRVNLWHSQSDYFFDTKAFRLISNVRLMWLIASALPMHITGFWPARTEFNISKPVPILFSTCPKIASNVL